MKKFFSNLWKDEDGIQTLEVMLIIGVVVIIALTFRTEIKSWIDKLVTHGSDQIDQIIAD
ncbi:Flp1 family type IVb pilin [Bacillus kwashiorkori]|uniref:Flp1 family type IVb pilin n=1 Tax=Bacillus kwashiorkori TaxID=1522318 RepID=UPI000784B37F|nr:Flp1 family type IVb pilin [Bacillus kwashiorkori]